jgi:hypothetical protein
MVFLFTPPADKTVNDVLSWLLTKKIPFKRFSSDEIYGINLRELSTIDINECTLSGVYWYRKGSLAMPTLLILNEELAKKVTSYLFWEWEHTTDFIFRQLETKKHLGNYFQRYPNKLWHLQIAQQAGLKVPDTLITTQKQEAKAFLQKHGSVINN